MLDNATKIRRKLEHLQALDLSAMGYQAQIRHQQQIEELGRLCDSRSPTGQDDQASGDSACPITATQREST